MSKQTNKRITMKFLTMLCFLILRPIFAMVPTQDFIRVNQQYVQLCQLYSHNPNSDLLPPELRVKATFQRQTQAELCIKNQQSFQTLGINMPRDYFDYIEQSVRGLTDNQITFDMEMKKMYEDYWSQKATGLNPKW